MPEFRVDTNSQLTAERQITAELERQLGITRQQLELQERIERTVAQRASAGSRTAALEPLYDLPGRGQVLAAHPNRIDQEQQRMAEARRAALARLDQERQRAATLAATEQQETFDRRFEGALDKLQRRRLAGLRGTHFEGPRQTIGDVGDIFAVLSGQGTQQDFLGAAGLGVRGAAALGLRGGAALASAFAAAAPTIGAALIASHVVRQIYEQLTHKDEVDGIAAQSLRLDRKIRELSRGELTAADFVGIDVGIFNPPWATSRLGFYERVRRSKELQETLADAANDLSGGGAVAAAMINNLVGEHLTGGAKRQIADAALNLARDPSTAGLVLIAQDQYQAHLKHERSQADYYERNPSALAEARNRDRAREMAEKFEAERRMDWNPN
ncbi:MAG: hypothetical protein M5U26_08475 [Planctomycetota bacterium]|nr:hypothetical protein [Planctomycetota bacterium]